MYPVLHWFLPAHDSEGVQGTIEGQVAIHPGLVGFAGSNAHSGLFKVTLLFCDVHISLSEVFIRHQPAVETGSPPQSLSFSFVQLAAVSVLTPNTDALQSRQYSPTKPYQPLLHFAVNLGGPLLVPRGDHSNEVV